MVREDNIQDKQSMVPGEEPRGVGRPRDPDEIRSMKQDIHRKIGLANKRIDRLNEQGLNNAPALRNLKETTGKERFSIKGYKSKNELRRLESQLDTFINQKTSTVTGVKKWQRNIADTLGINYTKVSEIGDSLDNFIELLNKLTQYQRSQGVLKRGLRDVLQQLISISETMT